MVQEYNINNFELYRLKDITPVGGITYYSNVATIIYRNANGYNFIIDNSDPTGNEVRIRKFDKSWNLISTYVNNETAAGKICDIKYINNFYYTVSYSPFPYIRKFNSDLTSSINSYYITPIYNIDIKGLIFYKNYYFIYGNTISGVDGIPPIVIIRFDSDINCQFTLNNPKIYTNTADFNNLLGTTTCITFQNNYINYKTGQWLFFSRNSGDSIAYLNVFNLDNLINETSYNPNKPYLERVLRTDLNEIPYCLFGGISIHNGHYILYETTLKVSGVNTIKKVHIYDFNWSKIAEFKVNESLFSPIFMGQNLDDRMIVFNNYNPISEQPIKIYKII